MEKFKIGYCPTMQVYAKNIASNIEEVEMIQYASAGQVLAMLKEDMLDGVLIGRTASSTEINAKTDFVRLKKGVTLAFKTKYGIPEKELKNVDVLTYLKPEQVEHVKHFFHQIYFLPSLDDCLKEKLEVPVIVDWNDFRDDFQLLIPMNENGKTQQFRAPVIYHKNIDNEIIDRIKVHIGNNLTI
jgi:hypothetical protein